MDALAIICDDPGRGGCASVARTLWRRLDVGRPKVLVTDLAGAPPGLFSEDELAGLPDRRIFPFPIDEKRTDSATFDIRRALDALERIAPAQIMFHDSRALESMLALKRAARSLAIPFSATQHLVLPGFDNGASPARAGDLRWTGAARRLVFVSTDNRSRFVERLPHCADKAIVIRNGVDGGISRWPDAGARATLRKSARAGEHEKLVVLVARLDPTKGQDIAVRALARPALPDAPLWRLILIGDDPDGWRSELERLAGSLGVSDRLSFLGRRRDARDLMPGADAVLQTGRAEGLPLSLLEAMAEGAPIVARAAGGVAEAIETGSALLLGAGDDMRVAEAAARALDRLVTDPDLARSLSSAARARFDDSYDSRSMMRSYAALSEELARDSTPQRPRGPRSARCARKPPFAIDFSRPGEAWNFLGRGWSAQESWGVMAQADGADLEIPIAADVGVPLRITFFLRSPGRRPGRTLEIESSGGAKTAWRFLGLTLTPTRSLIVAPQPLLRFRLRLASPGVDIKRLKPGVRSPLIGLRAIRVQPAPG